MCPYVDKIKLSFVHLGACLAVSLFEFVTFTKARKRGYFQAPSVLGPEKSLRLRNTKAFPSTEGKNEENKTEWTLILSDCFPAEKTKHKWLSQ